MTEKVSMGAATQEEVTLIRWHKLLCTLFDLTRGSIWWVAEDSWKKSNSRYDQDSTRDGHYGLSIRTAPPPTPYEMIPMLHGTSGTRGPVIARGLSRDRGADYPTSFGHLAPADFGVDEFRQGHVKRNEYKPKLTPAESELLLNWLKRRGLL